MSEEVLTFSLIARAFNYDQHPGKTSKNAGSITVFFYINAINNL
jgi:hypothetical protein